MGIPEINQKIITPKKHPEIISEYNIKSGKWIVSADAVVIGSGAGGAVAAAELSVARRPSIGKHRFTPRTM